VCLACASILDAFADIGPESRLACWLPLSNLFQRMINFCAIAQGGETYYVENPREIVRHLPGIAPHVFVAVPRFFEKFYGGLVETVRSGPGWRRWLFNVALANAKRLCATDHRGIVGSVLRPVMHRLLDALVLRRVRAVLGGQIRFLVSGSAPMPMWLLENFRALGMPVYEAYGMTENIIPVSANRPGAAKMGSVGKPLLHNEIRIAEDGELLVRGPGVFAGYLGEAPAERTPEGYYASGDYATQDPEGYITLTGRKSDVFKTSTGRRIAPAGVESQITQLPYVELAAVLGANRPFATAVVWIAKDRFVAEEAPLAPEATARIMEEIRSAVVGLPDYQRPAGIVLVPRPPSLEKGEITSNRKVRRKQIEANFASELGRLYAALQAPQGADVVVASE
jgi:long-chain acyl-CoA synthetase